MNDGQFYYFFGKVLDKANDESRTGQIKVHIYNNTDDLNDDEQLYCQVCLPLNSFGNDSVSLPVGALVFGFFADGARKRKPIILSQLSVNTNNEHIGYNGLNTTRTNPTGDIKSETIREVRNNKKYNIQNSLFSVVDSNSIENNFKSNEYTKVHTTQSESNIIYEINDTEGQEHIAIRLGNGDFLEMTKEGISLCTDKRVDIISKSDNMNVCSIEDLNIHAGNKCNIYVKNDCNINVDNNANIKVNNNCNVNIGGNGNIDIGNSCRVKSGGSMSFNAGGSMSFNAGGSMNLRASGQLSANASIIRLN